MARFLDLLVPTRAPCGVGGAGTQPSGDSYRTSFVPAGVLRAFKAPARECDPCPAPASVARCAEPPDYVTRAENCARNTGAAVRNTTTTKPTATVLAASKLYTSEVNMVVTGIPRVVRANSADMSRRTPCGVAPRDIAAACPAPLCDVEEPHPGSGASEAGMAPCAPRRVPQRTALGWGPAEPSGADTSHSGTHAAAGSATTSAQVPGAARCAPRSLVARSPLGPAGVAGFVRAGAFGAALDVLVPWFQAAARGAPLNGGLLLVTGPPGCGKRTLVEVAAHVAGFALYPWDDSLNAVDARAAFLAAYRTRTSASRALPALLLSEFPARQLGGDGGGTEGREVLEGAREEDGAEAFMWNVIQSRLREPASCGTPIVFLAHTRAGFVWRVEGIGRAHAAAVPCALGTGACVAHLTLDTPSRDALFQVGAAAHAAWAERVGAPAAPWPAALYGDTQPTLHAALAACAGPSAATRVVALAAELATHGMRSANLALPPCTLSDAAAMPADAFTAGRWLLSVGRDPAVGAPCARATPALLVRVLASSRLRGDVGSILWHNWGLQWPRGSAARSAAHGLISTLLVVEEARSAAGAATGDSSAGVLMVLADTLAAWAPAVWREAAACPLPRRGDVEYPRERYLTVTRGGRRAGGGPAALAASTAADPLRARFIVTFDAAVAARATAFGTLPPEAKLLGVSRGAVADAHAARRVPLATQVVSPATVTPVAADPAPLPSALPRAPAVEVAFAAASAVELSGAAVVTKDAPNVASDRAWPIAVLTLVVAALLGMFAARGLWHWITRARRDAAHPPSAAQSNTPEHEGPRGRR